MSEDATCKLWHADKNRPAYHTLKGHLGKSVRALATYRDGEVDMLATGGDDGAIKLYNLHKLEPKLQSVRLPMPDGTLPVLEAANENAKAKLKQVVNKIRSVELLQLQPEKQEEVIVVAAASLGSLFAIRPDSCEPSMLY